MAYAIRIDEIRVNPSGTIDVFITSGNTPLPAGSSSTAISFPSRLAAVAGKNNAINQADDRLLAIAMVIYSIAAADPNLLNAATGLLGKTLTFNANTPASVMSYA